MRNAPRIVLRNFKSIFCKQCLPDQERLKTKIPPAGGILCFCLLGHCLHSVPVHAKQTSTGRLAPPNPYERRFHLRRRSSSQASYRSFPRKHGNSFITLLVLSPTSHATCRGPLIRLFFLLLSFFLRLGFRIFDAEQSRQICLVGQQFTIRFFGLVVFCV